ncbi:uncharacterized protein LOC113769051 [Coffea eugenioides]|uniref:uncharacterized protein LOC113769051 n=1 Tax=Coffea eugenioides TaxID=49369 RepID=UPI000F60FCBB|nr:uncharacterized protein LOC113769051 [Coffea eugenioides]
MAASTAHTLLQIIFTFGVFIAFSSTPVLSEPVCVLGSSDNHLLSYLTFHASRKFQQLKGVRSYLRRINKPAVKIIESPDGDLIDCVPSHLQPAFDLPQLKGQKPQDPPERPNGYDSADILAESFQLWTDSGESCPEGTVPIRRTTEKDVRRAGSLSKFGRKSFNAQLTKVSSDHENAFAFAGGDRYYGAKVNLNVWKANETDLYNFSVSQAWILSGIFSLPVDDTDIIEAGWEINPKLYGDKFPRFFTHWTNDLYLTRGCYNLLCSGFVQTSNRISLGAAISPRLSQGGRQLDFGIMIWMDIKHGNWWLEVGPGLVVGYWPSTLFTHLKSHVDMVQFGGMIVRTKSVGMNSSALMGTDDLSDDGVSKASYFRNLQVVDYFNSLIPLSNFQLLTIDDISCYDIKAGRNDVWGNYFHYGGPGGNPQCHGEKNSTSA